MHTSDIYHTQGIRGFQVVNTNYGAGGVTVKIAPSEEAAPCCPTCHQWEVTRSEEGSRSITGLPCGGKKVELIVPVFRLHCPHCDRHQREPLPFVVKWSRHTKAVERSVVAMRREMSMKATADFFGLDWRTVKDIEKRHLQTKFRVIRLKEVRVIGIDEIHGGKPGYKTIVRDLKSGAVLFVGRGKGGAALAGFERRLRSAQCQIKVVAMDMSSGYSAWVKRVLPKVAVVFDHFHVIQLMNKKLNELRRTTMKNLDEETRQELKGKRFLLLRNQEALKTDEQAELERLKATFSDLSTGHAMKEKLRAIYRTAKSVAEARVLLFAWILAAEVSGIGMLKTMAHTIRSHLDGILAYWKFNELTSAGMEGFNNKIRWLIRQAYGFQDQEYFELKIYDLPTCTTVKAI